MSESKEQPRGFQEKIKNAIVAGNVENLFGVLLEVNNILVGLERGSFSPERGVESFKKELKKFLQTNPGFLVVYMGAGISRIQLAVDEDKIFIEISQNSSNEVKKKWEEIK